MCVCILYFRRALFVWCQKDLSSQSFARARVANFFYIFFCARSRFVCSFVRTADELCMEKVPLPHRMVSERNSPILTWQECSLSRARLWKSVTCRNCENSSSRAQLGWGDDTMNDDDLCSCNFKNKFHHPLSPLSSARYIFTRYLSWRWWCVVSLRVRCRVYMQSRDEAGRRKDDDDNKIVGTAQKSLSTSCDTVVVAATLFQLCFSISRIMTGWKFEFRKK